MENYICIGDVHGRYDLLDQLLTMCAEKIMAQTHKVVFLGDWVDRGPDSFEVINRIKAMCDAGSAIAILGNHDDMMLDYYREGIPQKHCIWTMNGGVKTMVSYTKHYGLYGIGHFFQAFNRSGHAQWLKSLPYFYETENVFFSHAPIPNKYVVQAGLANIRPFEGDFRANKEALTWTYVDRSIEGQWEHDHGKLAVCGHVHALREGKLEPRVYPQIIYADTGSGCAPHGRLSAVIITDGKYDGFLQAIPIDKIVDDKVSYKNI